MMRPVIEDLEKKYQKKYFGSICFFEVETSESALLAAQYQTALLPAFLIFKDRELIATMQGMIPQKELDLRLQKLLTAQMRTQSTENSLEIVNLYFLGKHTVLCYIKKVTGIKYLIKRGHGEHTTHYEKLKRALPVAMAIVLGSTAAPLVCKSRFIQKL